MIDTLDQFAAALVDPARAIPAGVNGRQAIADTRRFAVYRNNVHVSLVEALAKRYPVVQRLVGDEFFRAMARVYVGANKPRSPILIHYGADFAGFIAGFAPAAGLPYLADVARLESAWLDAYHAADAKPLGVAMLAAVPPEDLPGLRLAAHPAAQLIVSRFPVGSIWAAHQQATVAAIHATDGEAVLIVRPDAEVRVQIVPASDASFAAALLAGDSIAEAAGQADPHCAPAGALAGLVGLGSFQSIIEGSD